jgi:nucleotide-binding universal stress UspA family protein
MAMPLCKHILVVVDGTESSLVAAEYAVALAHLMEGRITAVGVMDTEILRKLQSARILVEQETRDFESQLEANHLRHLEYVQDLAREAGVPVEVTLRKGVCHSSVLAEQRQRKCDLVIVGAFRSTLTKIDVVARERQLIIDEVACSVLVAK